MSTTFPCNLEQFKKVVADFTKAARTCETIEELEAGWACVGLHFVGLTDLQPYEEVMSRSYLDYASRRFIECEVKMKEV